MNWKNKLTSRKFWTAVASFVALLIVAFGYPQAAATQITAIIMAGATVVAYIVGEGLVDAASVNITGNPTITGVGDTPTAGQEATTPDSVPVIGTVDASAPATNGTETGAAQAAEVKADTALSSTPAVAQPTTGSEVTAPTTPVQQAAAEAAHAAFPGLDNATMDQVNTAVEAVNIALGKTTDTTQQAQLNSALAALKVLQTAAQPESGAVAPSTNGAA